MPINDANRQLEERTLTFAVAVVRFVGEFPNTDSASVVGRRLLEAGTGIGANYRDANRSDSRDDFVHKSALVLKDASETDYWLELCTRAEIGDVDQREWLCGEARELLAIFTTIHRHAKGR
jgi:four helix bundle protein